MSQVSEVKCPVCGQWNKSTGRVDETCKACGGYLEPERFAHNQEVKIAEAGNGNYYLTIKDTDETIVQIFKMFINSIRWSAYYVAMLFFIIMVIILAIFGLVAI
jgi:hypothetical protein